jgi:uncharacterized protein (DUF1330 family)
MTAFFIATTTIKDAEKFQAYAAKAGPTIAAFGGEMIKRGKVEKILNGEANHLAVGVVQFPDMGTLEQWYNSPDYQALIPLRDESVNMTLVAYSVPA